MTGDTSIRTRLRKLMEEQEIGENELARRTTVPQPTIHRILKGASKSPRLSNLEKLATALGTTIIHLAHGDEPPRGVDLNERAGANGVDATSNAVATGANPDSSGVTPPTYHYPLLSWTQAASIGRASHDTAPDNLRVEPSGITAQGKGFWLEVRGDSMAAPTGMAPSLPEGTMVLFDSDAPATPGKLVLATLANSQDTTFRKLIKDSGQLYLKPLNPSYPSIALDDASIILAVALEARTPL